MDEKEARCLPALTLAYIGDAVYEMAIRCYLLEKGIRKPDELHKEAVDYVKAEFQAAFYHAILPVLTEAEVAVLKRGRNSKSAHQPKHADVQDYRKATAVEALFGALYLGGDEKRLEEILQKLYAFIGLYGKKGALTEPSFIAESEE